MLATNRGIVIYVLQISVGKAFKINKAIDFNNLHKLIVTLGYIMEFEASDYLSSYKEITDKDFISNILQPELINRLFNDSGYIGQIKFDTDIRFEHDFCNPNMK